MKAEPLSFRLDDHSDVFHEASGYPAAGHLYVVRHPLSKRHWVIVHKPSGLTLNPAWVSRRDFRTRAAAFEVARALVGEIPEFGTEDDIQSFVDSHLDRVRHVFRWACHKGLAEREGMP